MNPYLLVAMFIGVLAMILAKDRTSKSRRNIYVPAFITMAIVLGLGLLDMVS